MKRFVTYLYQYNNHMKVKNTGFAKIEVKNGQCKMEIVVKGADKTEGPATIFLFMGDEQALAVGNMQLKGGGGSLVVGFDENGIQDTSYEFKDIKGIAIRAAGVYMASSWVDEASSLLLSGDFQVRNTEQEMPEDILSEETKADVVEQLQPVLESSDLKYERIDLSDLKKLPKRNWYLCNNNFLLHGFFNYHYLIRKCVATENGASHYIGVPGVYERPERMLAMLFGFKEFEPVQQEQISSEIENAQPNEKDSAFGYYLCPIDLKE